MIKIKKALISVSDKSNVLELAKSLSSYDIEILSTGGTAKLLKENKINVTEVSDYTKFPEMLDGRVKTLHPKIHGGILGRRDNPEHNETMKNHEIDPIDLVVVNLYPFEETINQEGCTLEHAIENIDIGGPAMIRSAAKNYQHVAVLTNPKDYKSFTDEINKNQGSITLDLSFSLAKKAFEKTSAYDSVINNYLSSDSQNQFPDQLTKTISKVMDLRYGENPHQGAAFYKDSSEDVGSLSSFDQIQGKELSFNNLNDSDTAWECVKKFSQPTCVIVKHANPCGVSINRDSLKSYKLALASDPVSAFGGIVSCNFKINKTLALELNKIFLEVIIANGFEANALKILKKKKNIRIIDASEVMMKDLIRFGSVNESILTQSEDLKIFEPKDFKIVSKLKPNKSQLKNLIFAFNVCRYVKSNAIVLACHEATVGIGSGQPSRLDSCQIAIDKMNKFQNLKEDVVAASDAFFPFVDGIEKLVQSGVSAVIQPSGSIRDKEIIKFANQTGTILVFSKTRHFRH